LRGRTLAASSLCSDKSGILVSLKNTETVYFFFVLIPGVGMWGCFELSKAADYDLPHALAEVVFVSCR
ncbi:mCG65186, partial [Mus musculus]